MTTPSTGTGTPGTSLTPGGAGSCAQSRTDQVAGVLVTPVALAQRVLPASPLPVALGTGALLLAGVVEWPVAGALALGYLALAAGAPAPEPQPASRRRPSRWESK